MAKFNWTLPTTSNSLKKIFINFIISCNLLQIVNFSTRKNNTFDLIFTNKKMYFSLVLLKSFKNNSVEITPDINVDNLLEISQSCVINFF